VASHGFALVARSLVPDETSAIVPVLLEWADRTGVDLIVTTGGTGLTPRDFTPEATRAVLDREAPGIAEAIRMEALARFPRAALSRGLAGVRGRTLIVNLPGSIGGVNDGLTVLTRWVHHAIELVTGTNTPHERIQDSGFRIQKEPLNPGSSILNPGS